MTRLCPTCATEFRVIEAPPNEQKSIRTGWLSNPTNTLYILFCPNCGRRNMFIKSDTAESSLNSIGWGPNF